MDSADYAPSSHSSNWGTLINVAADDWYFSRAPIGSICIAPKDTGHVSGARNDRWSCTCLVRLFGSKFDEGGMYIAGSTAVSARLPYADERAECGGKYASPSRPMFGDDDFGVIFLNLITEFINALLLGFGLAASRSKFAFVLALNLYCIPVRSIEERRESDLNHAFLRTNAVWITPEHSRDRYCRDFS